MLTNQKLIRICTMLAIFTSSFDIFGMVNIGGFNFRFCQWIILPVIALYLRDIVSVGRFSVPKCFPWLLVWIILQFVFCFRSPSLKNAFGYFLWLIFNSIIICATYHFCGRAYSEKWLIKTYLYSFIFIAVIGLIQLILYAIGINFYVAQHWTGRLARINGFSYEPSFYATYLLMGVVTYGCLLFSKKVEWISKKNLKIGFSLVFIAMILSSSRMGWLMTAVFIGYELIYNLLKKLLTTGRVKKKMFLFFPLALVLFTFAIVIVVRISKIDPSMFLFGLGIGGSSAHSANDRINGLEKCINIFKESPIFGYSLGGVDPMIAKYDGIVYSTLDNGRAMSVIGEILVASGITGLIPFFLYIATLIWGRVKAASDEASDVIRALRVAMVFELAILCFNQNILRPYTWLHMAILSAAMKMANRQKENECAEFHMR